MWIQKMIEIIELVIFNICLMTEAFDAIINNFYAYAVCVCGVKNGMVFLLLKGGGVLSKF